ncbi:MAG: hypothetical protein ACWGPN_05385 [Gammaproteobacteria bacterium]
MPQEPQRGICIGKCFVELQRPLDFRFDQCLDVFPHTIAVVSAEKKGSCKSRMAGRKIRVEFYRFPKRGDRQLDIVGVAPLPELRSSQKAFVGRDTRSRGRRISSGESARAKCSDDVLCNLVLYRKNVVGGAIEGFGPEMRLVADTDELGDDP